VIALLSTPQWWFDTIVVPNHDVFVRDPLSERRAFNALVTTYHMWERLYWYYFENGSPHLGGRSKDDFLNHLKSPSQCPELEEIGMAANSAKHTLRVSKGKQPTFVLQNTATGQTQVATPGSGPMRLPSGHEVGAQLTRVMDFWRKWLREHPDP
jgi:hypothetical protein